MDTSKSKLAYQAMRKLILTKKWAPGQRFSVLEVSSKLKISRTPVSDAVKLLAAEGFVKMLPHKGFEIGSYSTSELKDSLEIKMVLEGLAAYKAAQNTSVEDKNILSEIIESQRKCIQEKDTECALKCDQALHYAIFNLSNSPKLEKMTTALYHQGHYYADIFVTPDELSEIFQEHIDLVEAIINSKPEEARKISEKHSLRYMKNLLAKINDLSSKDFEDLKQDISIEELLLSNIQLTK
jgi:DNA-binding GntR family transcriptional regulator